MTLHAAPTTPPAETDSVLALPTDSTQAVGQQSHAPAGARPSRRLIRRLVIGLLLAGDLTMVIAYGYLQSIEVPTFHLDGAFQTASGLLRLHEGDLPGRDFFPYLGIGPVFAVYPLFAVAGGTVSGSVLSAWAVTAAVLALLVGVIFALALRARSISAVLGGAGLLLVILVLGPGRFWGTPAEVQALLAPLFSIGVPGNSLRPVRAAAPLLLVALTVLALTRLPRKAGLIVTGSAFGVVIACWSNDFALVPSAVVLAFVLHHGIRARRWRLRELLTLGGSGALGFLVSGFAATGGHYVEYAAYNFRDVLGDQFWYFGAWSPRFRVYAPGDLVNFVGELGAAPGLALLLALSLLVLVRPTLRWTGIAALGWAAFAGGTVAMIGGHFDDYLLPFRVWTVVAGAASAASLLRFLMGHVLKRLPPMLSIRLALRVASTILVVVLVAAGAVREVRSAALQHQVVASDPGQRFVPALGGFLPASFADHVAGAPANGAFVEEYAGLWTALRGPNRTQKVDAVIHALGSERTPFAEALMDDSTTTAVTTAPEMSTEWVAWNLSANWWYFRNLLHSFTPAQTSPTTVVWTRAAEAPDPVSGRCTASSDGQSITVSPASTGLNEVTVEYRGPGRGKRTFSMLQNRINGAMDSDGFVALDPGAPSQSLPIYVPDRDPIQYDLRNVPGGTPTTITGCRTASVPFPAGSDADALYASLWATDRRPIPFTDASYSDGLRTESAGFIVGRSAPNMADYRVGTRVQLADGQIRTVIEATPSYNMLVVYLDGEPLSPDLLDSKAVFTPIG